MDFKKKLKRRLYLGILYVMIGVAMIIVALAVNGTSDYLSPFGTAFLVIGIARIRNYFIITKSDETIKKQQIAETDERNITISNKAKGFSFNLYVMLAYIAVIILQIMKITELATTIGMTVCTLLIIYWISYFILQKKS